MKKTVLFIFLFFQMVFLRADTTDSVLDPLKAADEGYDKSKAVESEHQYEAAGAEIEYKQAELAYKKNELLYITDVFRWQYKSSIIIFFMVVLVVLTGLVFAGIQFYISMKQMGGKIRKGALVGIQTAPADTNLEFTTSGVKVNSSVLGVIILVISIGFFYLYLGHVYPIKVIDAHNGSTAEKN